MTAYARHELEYARPLAAGTICNGPFRAWLSGRDDLAEATHDPLLQSRLRSPGMKNPYWFNYWCGTCDKLNPYGCKIGTGIESDILLVFAKAERRTALHIEVKSLGDSLRDGQALSYPRRAACWSDASRRPKTVPAYEDWRTILVHGDSALTPEEEQSFQRVVTHEEVASWLTDYPQT